MFQNHHCALPGPSDNGGEQEGMELPMVTPGCCPERQHSLGNAERRDPALLGLKNNPKTASAATEIAAIRYGEYTASTPKMNYRKTDIGNIIVQQH